MSRRRSINPNIWQSEDFSKLSLLARLLFIGMFSMADDYGKGRGKPNYLKSTIFPYDDGMRLIDVEKALSEIGSNMSVTFYAHDGNDYYKLDNWDKWQTVDKPQPSNIPDFEPLLGHSRIIRESFANDSPLSKEKLSKEKLSEDKYISAGASAKHKHGEYGWIMLTDEEYRRLENDCGETTVKHYITYVDEYVQSNKNKNGYKDWNLTIRRAIRDKWDKNYIGGKSAVYNPNAVSNKSFTELAAEARERGEI